MSPFTPYPHRDLPNGWTREDWEKLIEALPSRIGGVDLTEGTHRELAFRALKALTPKREIAPRTPEEQAVISRVKLTYTKADEDPATCEGAIWDLLRIVEVRVPRQISARVERMRQLLEDRKLTRDYEVAEELIDAIADAGLFGYEDDE